MALDKQIHLYSLDTACFYTESEVLIDKKLTRCFSIRTKINDKKYKLENLVKKGELEKEDKKLSIYRHQYKKINKIIKIFKNQLIEEFNKTDLDKDIRELRTELLTEKRIISVFESSLIRTLGIETNKLTKNLMVIQTYYFQVAESLIKKGFLLDGEKYVLFSASAGQIRTKKFVMIKESELKSCENTLTCGLSWNIINSKGGINANKYLAYYALANSATDIWSDFDIDKSIVVEDFETMVKGVVDFIDDSTYKITRKEMDILIPHTDGSGMVDGEDTKIIRLPWMKGLMGEFKFRELILQWRKEFNNDKIGIIKDIYGREYDIISENIKYIFTKSQFKMYKFYDSWEHYKNNFKKYKCEACVCSKEEDEINDATINYQMLQTLTDITLSEMKILSNRNNITIEKLHEYKIIKKLLGFLDNNENKNYMQLN